MNDPQYVLFTPITEAAWHIQNQVMSEVVNGFKCNTVKDYMIMQMSCLDHRNPDIRLHMYKLLDNTGTRCTRFKDCIQTGLSTRFK